MFAQIGQGPNRVNDDSGSSAGNLRNKSAVQPSRLRRRSDATRPEQKKQETHSLPLAGLALIQQSLKVQAELVSDNLHEFVVALQALHKRHLVGGQVQDLRASDLPMTLIQSILNGFCIGYGGGKDR